MYRNSYFNYQYYNPMHYNNWSYIQCLHYYNRDNHQWSPHFRTVKLGDYERRPFVVNIDQAAKQNNTYRTTLWTGEQLQVTLMSINAGDDIGLEVHPTTDQFIRVEEGEGLVQISKDKLDFQKIAYDDYAIMIPAGKWHNVINMGNIPLKIYVIYAPPEHPYGTVHETKSIAMSAEENHQF